MSKPEASTSNENPKLTAARLKAAELAKQHQNAKGKEFTRLDVPQVIKLEDGQSLQGTYMGTVISSNKKGDFLNHVVINVDDEGEPVTNLLAGSTVVNELLSKVPGDGSKVIRVTRKGHRISEGKRTVFLYEVRMLG